MSSRPEIKELAALLLERVDDLGAEMAAWIRSVSGDYHYDVVSAEDLEQTCRA